MGFFNAYSDLRTISQPFHLQVLSSQMSLNIVIRLGCKINFWKRKKYTVWKEAHRFPATAWNLWWVWMDATIITDMKQVIHLPLYLYHLCCCLRARESVCVYLRFTKSASFGIT